VSSLTRILPFLRPIEDLLCDPTVTEVMVNDGGRRVFVERAGAFEPVPDRTLEPRNLSPWPSRTSRVRAGTKSLTRSRSSTRGWKMDHGSRPCFPPCAVDGPALTIRKFTRRFSLDDLVEVGTLTPGIAATLGQRGGDATERAHFRRHRNRENHAY